MKTPATTHRIALLGAALAALVLAGCSDRLSDLTQYAKEVRARKGGHIEPPPQLKPFPTYTYADEGLPSPFVAQLQSNYANANMPKGVGVNGLRPDTTRNREYLEQFPLDGLKMVGTLTIGKTLYGLVKDSNNVVTKVVVGNYMGQNYGKIVSISDDDIKLREIVPDGQGGWAERITDVALSE
ncbi:MAG: pilus assembly protein PilP [Bacillota bacterium]